jgi:hypothetical protein
VPPRAPVRASRALLATLLLAACNEGITAPSSAEELVVIAGGTDPAGRVILESADRFDTVMVRVLDASARPVPNVAVTWSTDDPDALVTPLDDASDADGVVRAEWRLSGAPGTWKLRAVASAGVEAEAAFTITSWSVQHAVFINGRTCVQSHDDRLWCRADDLAPLELQLGGATIRSLDGTWGTRRSTLCIITNAGVVQCADNAAETLVFVDVPGQVTSFASIALGASSETFCALDEAGRAWCWGRYFLGDGAYHATPREEMLPVVQPDDVTFTALAVNGGNGCALDSTGMPWCWGYSHYGVTGVAGGPSANVPRAVAVPAPLVTIEVPAHSGSACGLTADRRAICWGNGLGFGALGHQEPPRVLAGVGDALGLVPLPDGYIARRVKGELMGWGTFYFGHSNGIGGPGPLPASTLLRARAISRGLGLPGRTCFDDAFGNGTVCAPTRDLASTTANPILWIGLQPPD